MVVISVKLFPLLVLFLLVGTVAGQEVDIDAAIERYLSPGEDYSTLEIVMQSSAGAQLSNVLVIIGNAPAFVVYSNGSLVEDEEAILSVSQDYVGSRPGGMEVASAESIAAAISRETQRRKEKAVIKEAGENAVQKAESMGEKIQKARALLPGADFATVNRELVSFQDAAANIATSYSTEEATELSVDFNEEVVGFSEFVDSLDQNAVKLGVVVNLTRESRQALNEKILKVGRDDASVVQSQAELSEIEEQLLIELSKIKTLTPLEEGDVNSLYEKTQTLRSRLGAIQGTGPDLVSTILPFVVILLIIGGVVFYFKKLREKQGKEETGPMPPEPGLPT